MDALNLHAGEMDHHHMSPHEAGFLEQSDGVGISFWIISIAMVATTVFLVMESQRVQGHWKTSMSCGALVTLVAGVHYFYMREFWVKVGESPIVYRYIDWSITVPLQMIEFYLILDAASKGSGGGKRVGSGMFWRLLIGTVVMLACGYAGETGNFAAWPAFIGGMAGWAFILMEIFAGEASTVSAENASVHVQKSFNNMRLIVSVGWSIYPLGYFFGLLSSGVVSITALNVIYNIADFVNKIGFVLAVWACAVAETEEHESEKAQAGHLP
jgi:bacteriorhodopsin